MARLGGEDWIWLGWIAAIAIVFVVILWKHKGGDDDF